MTSTGMAAHGKIPIINSHYPNHDSTEELAAAPAGAALLYSVTTSCALIRLDRNLESEGTAKIGFVRARFRLSEARHSAILADLASFASLRGVEWVRSRARHTQRVLNRRSESDRRHNRRCKHQQYL